MLDIKRRKHNIVVNGIKDEKSHYSKNLTVYINNQDIVDSLIANSFQDLSNKIRLLHFFKEINWWRSVFSFNIFCDTIDDVGATTIRIGFSTTHFDKTWIRPYSIATFGKEINRLLNQLNNKKISHECREFDQLVRHDFDLTYHVGNINSVIKAELDYLLSLIKKIAEEANKSLIASLDTDSIITFYTFPDEIKMACRQYLVYF